MKQARIKALDLLKSDILSSQDKTIYVEEFSYFDGYIIYIISDNKPIQLLPNIRIFYDIEHLIADDKIHTSSKNIIESLDAILDVLKLEDIKIKDINNYEN